MPSRETLRTSWDEAIKAAEGGVEADVLEAMTVWLDDVREAVVPGVTPRSALTAAGPPDLSNWPPQTVWVNLVRNVIAPRLLAMFGDSFRAFARAANIAAGPYIEAFAQALFDRLSPTKWPQRVWDDVQAELQEAISQGESTDQLAQRLGDMLNINALSRALRARAAELRQIRDDPASDAEAVARARAELTEIYSQLGQADRQWLPDARRIARTETMAAINGGAFEAARAYAAETGEWPVKEWLATEDERTRPTHRAADGQRQPLLEPFDVGNTGLMFPGDPTGPANEVINCRCALLVD